MIEYYGNWKRFLNQSYTYIQKLKVIAWILVNPELNTSDQF